MDFALEEKKIDVEIDGSQHWLDPKIVKHDKIRTEKLSENGWTTVRIRWDDWQIKSVDERKQWILDFKKKYLLL